ncbi:MAG: UDP-N-acetylmuramate--L-alanine ligase [Elusimicrobia bacterium]|nr:UDP-N-acetylmuramate--L-alanine ligase [Elusimicrobiota bacterium]
MIDGADFGFEDIKNVHFIGIGGIGMSGIARLLLKTGFAVSGSDLKESEITRTLKAEGARVFTGHKAGNAAGADVVVISSAVKADNPELKRAVKKGVKIIPRARMLAKIADLKKTVTVSGSHGKTTTASMLASALEGAGADATVVVGGLFKNIASNMKLGAGEYLVAEADESDGSFLYFSPLVACVTNIDSDHLDFYKNMDNLKKAFARHLEKVPFYGAAVVCADDPGAAEVMKNTRAPLITYGFKAGAHWSPANLAQGAQGVSYDAFFKGRRMGRVRLRSGGRHNALNSLAALAAGHYLGFDFNGLARGLAAFKGVKRRMEKIGRCAGVTFLDDYGHHPTEIKATLETVAAMNKGARLIVLFQPHRYSRTKILRRDFPGAFVSAELVYVTEIYAAGEKPLPGITSGLLLNGIKKSGIKAEKFPGAMEIAKNLRSGDVFITVGAGDVWKLGEEVKLKLETIKSA